MVKAKSTVCILDADPAIRDSLEVLVDQGDEAVCSFSSIHAFMGSLNSVDVKCLLCAAELPDGNGIELFIRLKHMQADFPFALLISENMMMTHQRAIAAGIPNVFRKPIADPGRLLKFIYQS